MIRPSTRRQILSIGYGRQLFEAGNAERARLAACALETDGLHHIVFSGGRHGLKMEDVNPSFTLYPTNSRFRVLMVVDAIRLGLRLLYSRSHGTPWSITAQDPLAAGLVAYVLHILTRHPFVLQEHGDIFSNPPAGGWRQESLAHRIWFPLACFLMRRASRVRAVSERVRTHLIAIGVPAERIVVLPVHTDIGAIVHAQPTEDLRTSYAQASCIILSVARFVPQKNLALLIDAFAELHKKDDKALLVLVGSGPLEAALRKDIAVRDLTDAVAIHPWSKDVISLMKTADMYALSSNYEGWGRVLIEAMSSGLPSVATEVGCVGEAYTPGIHGLSARVGNAGDFRQAFLSLAGDSEMRRRFGLAAREAAEEAREAEADYAIRWAGVFAPAAK